MSKSFDDFIETLDDNKINDIIGNNELVKFELTNEGMQEYTNIVLSKSFKMATNLLRNYHDWLNH